MKWILSLVLCVLGSQALAQVNVPFERIRASANQPGNWLTFGGNYFGQRHSTLDQITTANVKDLKAAWVFQSKEAGKWECTPIVIDGVLYISERPNIITALDGKTGAKIWNYR